MTVSFARKLRSFDSGLFAFPLCIVTATATAVV